LKTGLCIFALKGLIDYERIDARRLILNDFVAVNLLLQVGWNTGQRHFADEWFLVEQELLPMRLGFERHELESLSF
jgi:hypothetical protein